MRPALAAIVIAAAASTGARADEPLTRDAVNALVQQRVGDVGACYQKALVKKPWLAGLLVVSFTVEDSGAVGRVEIERTEIPDVAFLACAQEVVRASTFARAPGRRPATFSFPFLFAGGHLGDPSVLVDGRAMPTVLPDRCTLPAQCRQLGVSLTRGDAGDRARAFEFFQAGCKLNDGASCAGAAAALDVGRGVTKDKSKAFGLYARACALHEVRACTSVAMAHALGVEGIVKKDERLGEKLLERACAAGEGGACLNLSERLRFGVGVARDEARAAEIRRAALGHD
ncbi:MAG TPA: AgmX/PglI C-terminal domain-containing protein [Polyangia bacterium]|nr:AgmX/PglI C-terminal domain-containing protein [Polyangia bacterium]